ncbi:hypothetical protein B0H17DRAFT_1034924 [Mycena rosella]|uniref:Uncharacterized protein n=1 Tax=Mycena rosella TaxID=1033263 RepID=A0AAD7M9M3_MYCRO|nr:hypothetical protein B0H17DRAFT_1034924 [Mycena rosella]
MTRILALSLLSLALHYAAAADTETSIIVPFGDPQAISADILGVDAKLGRTTWALRQGAYTGTWTDPQGSFPGTATLVEGADYASFTYAVAPPDGFTVGGECSLKDGLAVCVAAGEGTTVTETDSVTAFGVEIAQTAAPPVPSGSGNSGAGGASGTPPSGTGSGAPSSTQPSSSIRIRASTLGALVGLFMACRLA